MAAKGRLDFSVRAGFVADKAAANGFVRLLSKMVAC